MSIEQARQKHNELVKQLAKLQEKRDRAIIELGRADAKVRKQTKLIVRSTKRIDKARQEERAAKRRDIAAPIVV